MGRWQKRSQSTNETGVCGFLKSHVVYFAYYKCDVTLWSEIQNSRQTRKDDSLSKPSPILIWNMNSSLTLHILLLLEKPCPSVRFLPHLRKRTRHTREHVR